jgi:predicted transcriptional regulator
MAREAKDVTEAELALLQVLWDRGRCSTRQITDLLYPHGSAAQYATVQKLLERLESKSFVARDRTLFVHTFTAAVDRDELIGRRLRGLADTLCGGSLAPIVSQLARSGALSDAERKKLRELIDETDTTPGDSRKSARRRGTKG